MLLRSMDLSSFSIWIFNFSTTAVEKAVLSLLHCLGQISVIHVCLAYLWALCSVPFISLYVNTMLLNLCQRQKLFCQEGNREDVVQGILMSDCRTECDGGWQGRVTKQPVLALRSANVQSYSHSGTYGIRVHTNLARGSY